ncbi:FtsX-like permease family protein [Candidatus Bathyarchaeota archaeon]|nr:FtsX-like permease family protein [Candidatus Bathyarchaeota archaeon]
MLATTLFSGILQGADASAVSMLTRVIDASDIDMVSGAENRNLTKTAFREVENAISGIEGVKSVDHIVRFEMEVSNFTDTNSTIPLTIVAISNDSNLLKGVKGVEYLEKGKIYVEGGSGNITRFKTGEIRIFRISTYNPYGTLVDIRFDYYNLTVGGVVELDDRVFSIAMGRYPLFVRSLLIGSEASEKRPPHQLAIIGEETLWEILNPIYEKNRRTSKVLIPEIIIGLDRDKFLVPWDIAGSRNRINVVYDKINGIGARQGFVPVNYLGDLLTLVQTNSQNMKITTIIVATPIFFVAWYLGIVISDLSYNKRRREIGLLLIRGVKDKQLFYIFLFEAFFVSLIAGVFGIFLEAFIVPLVMSELNPLLILSSLSPTTITASLLFSIILSLLAIYKPARDATRLDAIDALKEYRIEEEGGRVSWHEPAIALALGAYKLIMFLFEINVDSFAPSSGNLIVYLLYSTWWGVDYLLTYIAPVLFFWGFIKLFLQHSTLIHRIFNRIFHFLFGEVSVLSILSSQRSMKRVVASTFMVAIIFGYNILVIGSIDGANDYIERSLKFSLGADACVWLFSYKGSDEISNKIAALEGVEGATVEVWFDAQSDLGMIEVRIIDPINWSKIAYIEPGWIKGEKVFENMNGTAERIILENGAAKTLGFDINDTILIKMGVKTYSLNIIGIFGREPPQNWVPSGPMIYVGKDFIKNLDEEDIRLTRILIKFSQGADENRLKKFIEELDPNISSVDMVNQSLKRINTNLLFTGALRIQQLGVYFAVVLSSVGVTLIMSAILQSRWKEIILLSIRGFSSKQLATILLLENVFIIIFAMFLGSAVGFVYLRGQNEILNISVQSLIERRILFSTWFQINLASIIGIVFAATVIPIFISVRKSLERLNLNIIESEL